MEHDPKDREYLMAPIIISTPLMSYSRVGHRRSDLVRVHLRKREMADHLGMPPTIVSMLCDLH
jgi:hypothetical protein